MKKIIAGLRPRRRPPWSLVQLAAAFIFTASAAHAGMGQILASWPDPLYNRVNGVCFDGEYVWLNNAASETRGVLKCTTTGSLVSEIGFPYHYWGPAFALAYDGTYLWTIFHQPVGHMIYDRYVQYTTTGSEVSHFGTHLSRPGVSKSVSWDGEYLWTEEWRYTPAKAGKYTTAGSLVGTYAMAPHWRTDAGYYNHQLWAGGNDGYVYGMNIAGGLVGSFPAPGGSCRAVGFDGEYLWTADANTPQYIYKVDIDVVDVEPGSFGKIKGIYR